MDYKECVTLNNVSVSVVARESEGVTSPRRLARAPISQFVQGSCQAFTVAVTVPGPKSHCTSPLQADPYSAVARLPRMRTLGVGPWKAFEQYNAGSAGLFVRVSLWSSVLMLMSTRKSVSTANIQYRLKLSSCYSSPYKPPKSTLQNVLIYYNKGSRYLCCVVAFVVPEWTSV